MDFWVSRGPIKNQDEQGTVNILKTGKILDFAAFDTHGHCPAPLPTAATAVISSYLIGINYFLEMKKSW
jgi:hypothetical protein